MDIGIGFGIGSAGGAASPNGNPVLDSLVVVSDTSIQFNLSTTATNQDGTYAYYSTTELGIYTLGATIVGSGVQGLIEGLTANTEYFIKLAHYKGTKLSSYSNILSDSTNSLSITNFAVFAYTGGTRITWTDIPANIGDVIIYRSTDGGDFVEVGSVVVGTQVYEDAITGDHVLVYKLRAVIAPYTYCAEYQAVYNQYTTKPSTEVAYQQDLMVRKMITDETFATIDAMWLFACHINSASESLINWKTPSGDKALAVDGGAGEPSFTAYEGFTGNGSNNYINLKWNPTDDEANFSQDDGSFIVGVYAKGTKNYLFGAVSTHYSLALYNSQTVLNSSYNTTGSATALSKYYTSAIRKASNSVTNYVNKAAGTSEAVNSTGINTVDFYALARNNASNLPTDFGDCKLSTIVFGTFNETQKNLIIDAIETYMDTNGKGIL